MRERARALQAAHLVGDPATGTQWQHLFSSLYRASSRLPHALASPRVPFYKPKTMSSTAARTSPGSPGAADLRAPMITRRPDGGFLRRRRRRCGTALYSRRQCTPSMAADAIGETPACALHIGCFSQKDRYNLNLIVRRGSAAEILPAVASQCGAATSTLWPTILNRACARHSRPAVPRSRRPASTLFGVVGRPAEKTRGHARHLCRLLVGRECAAAAGADWRTRRRRGGLSDRANRIQMACQRSPSCSPWRRPSRRRPCACGPWARRERYHAAARGTGARVVRRGRRTCRPRRVRRHRARRLCRRTAHARFARRQQHD